MVTSPRRWRPRATPALRSSASSPSPRASALPRARGEARRSDDFRRWLVASAFGHVFAIALLFWMPSPRPAPLPGVVTVDLVSFAAPAAASARAAARPALPPPAPKPVPKPVEAAAPKPVPPAAAPEPPKPAPKPEPPKPAPPRNEVVIPKKPEREPEKPAQKPEPEPEPEPPKPREVAKAAPPPKPEPAKPPPPKPAAKPQESYDDLLAELRAERGESRPEKVDRGVRTAAADAPAGAASARTGSPVSPEVAGWVRAVQIHVGQAWMLPLDMRGQRLMTELLVDLDASGRVLSEPRVVRGSGDGRFDESAVRAIQKASPLPAPPSAGVWTIGFCPECKS